MSDECILFEVKDRVATITLNRPELLNAVNGPLVRGLLAALAAADEDDDVRAVIVTGAGRGFCSGADLSRGAESFIAPGTALSPSAPVDLGDKSIMELGGHLAIALYNLKKPVIGAINGGAAGMGATLILPMDIRICSDQAKFGFVFSRRAMTLETGASFFLPRIVGISTALEWCLSGRMVMADEALEHGLVSAVVPQDQLLVEAQRIAREIADTTSPVSVALIRQMLWKGLGMSHPMEASRIESRGMYVRARDKDAKEGIMSFLEKRAPDFPDKVSTGMPDFYPWWEEPEYY